MKNNYKELAENRRGFNEPSLAYGQIAEEKLFFNLRKLEHIFKPHDEFWVHQRNPDKYGIDFQVFDSSGALVAQIEVMRRQSIKYPNIFIEHNKLRYIQDDVPTYFFIFNDSMGEMLALMPDKNLNDYEVVSTNYNSLGEDEMNIKIPRSEFDVFDTPFMCIAEPKPKEKKKAFVSKLSFAKKYTFEDL